MCTAVTDAFSLLGHSVMQSICYYLETGYDLKIQEIPQRTKDFDIAIRALFGPGAPILEDMILNRLQATVGNGVPFRSPGQQMGFEECVGRVAKFYRSKENQIA